MTGGTLYVVATPIGNLSDITLRALEVLAAVDIIAAEDTRRSRGLLDRHGIDTPLISLHEHNEDERSAELVARLADGASVALVSDAGTPLISDPGYRLVSAAHDAGLRVVPIPGASAVPAALSVAGIATDRFVFEGFLPARANRRRERLELLAREPRTLVIFEAPHRLRATLADMRESMGASRMVTVARELTKHFETFYRGSLDQVIEAVEADRAATKGELVIVVAGAGESPVLAGDSEKVLEILGNELPPRQAARLAARLTGADARELYRRLADARSGRDDDADSGSLGGGS
ncbi:MAG: 16S rRNA (cytidine(1402)-2'-O)-methyltransferase [Gammaproteobacteria bacterium]|nr:16S rRNA (cytidine(1402)-2'-O)-methyltransferase [Gammaproteobacteria bacterium]